MAPNFGIDCEGDACSSRSTPKPRPPSPTLRPNITIQTYTCPSEYDAHYCLNGATCFTVKIGESILYNCECAEGYMGQRCEFKDLDGSYLPSKHRAMLEQAGITSGVAIMVVFVIIVCFYLYVRSRRKSDFRRSNGHDEVDTHTFVRQARPFSGLHSPIPFQQYHPSHLSSSPPHHHHHPFDQSQPVLRLNSDSHPIPATTTSPTANVPLVQSSLTSSSSPPTSSSIIKPTVILKETSIAPNNNQSRLCV